MVSALKSEHWEQHQRSETWIKMSVSPIGTGILLLNAWPTVLSLQQIKLKEKRHALLFGACSFVLLFPFYLSKWCSAGNRVIVSFIYSLLLDLLAQCWKYFKVIKVPSKKKRGSGYGDWSCLEPLIIVSIIIMIPWGFFRFLILFFFTPILDSCLFIEAFGGSYVFFPTENWIIRSSKQWCTCFFTATPSNRPIFFHW